MTAASLGRTLTWLTALSKICSILLSEASSVALLQGIFTGRVWSLRVAFRQVCIEALVSPSDQLRIE